jgi:hypothetical protein
MDAGAGPSSSAITLDREEAARTCKFLFYHQLTSASLTLEYLKILTISCAHALLAYSTHVTREAPKSP